MDPTTIMQASQLVTNGSPTLLHAVGRLAGLGEAEQGALLRGAFPAWGWVLVGIAAGWFGGVHAQSRGWARGWLSR